jgi:hypothetical protein
MKVSEFSETFFVVYTSHEKWARRHSDKVFALPTEQFQRSELEKIFCEKGIFAINLQESVQTGGCDCKMIAQNHLTT